MKKFWALALTLLAVLATALTLFMAGNFKTTAQQEAEASPPPASEITAQVTSEKFRDSIPVTCSLNYETTKPLQPSSELAPNAQYTKISVSKDEVLKQGSLIAEINGAPVFSAIGPFAFYRDLRLDDRGPDARMLNSILAELGYQYERTGYAEADLFNQTTLDALGALYQGFGYDAPSKETGFAASSMIVFPSEQTVVSDPRGTGAVTDAPIAQVTADNQKILCKGIGGQLSPEIQVGQQVLLYAGAEENRVDIVSLETEKTSATQTEAQTENAGADTAASTIVANTPDNLPTDLKNMSGEVIISESSGTRPVVPASALWSKEGKTFVTIFNGDSRQDVEVRVIYSAQGLHEVEPLQGALEVGSVVRVNGSEG